MKKASFEQVDLEGNLVNAYVSSKTPGRVELERIGNINDIKQIPIDGIADISMGADGMMMWAFTDSEEKLEINPLALVQGDADVRFCFCSNTVAQVALGPELCHCVRCQRSK